MCLAEIWLHIKDIQQCRGDRIHPSEGHEIDEKWHPEQ